jgi:hypothetical protein
MSDAICRFLEQSLIPLYIADSYCIRLRALSPELMYRVVKQIIVFLQPVHLDEETFLEINYFLT